MVVEARSRLCVNRFLTIGRSIAVLRTKNRRKYGPLRRIRSPANQSPTGSLTIGFHLDGLREDGLPVPAPSSHVDYVDIAA